MKRYILFTTLCLLTYGSAGAAGTICPQPRNPALMAITVKGGICRSYYHPGNTMLSRLDDRQYRPVNGLNTGIELQWYNSRRFAFAASVAYIEKGVRYRHTGEDVMPDGSLGYKFTRIGQNYLSISPLAHIKIRNGRLIPYLIAGPRLDVLISQSSDRRLHRIPAGAQRVVPGITTGTGLEYYVHHRISLLLEGVYMHDVFDGPGRSSAISVQLGLKWTYKQRRVPAANFVW